jgi:hypothetical protein
VASIFFSVKIDNEKLAGKVRSVQINNNHDIFHISLVKRPSLRRALQVPEQSVGLRTGLCVSENLI